MDTISNMFVIIKNALSNKEKVAEIPYSKIKLQILEIMKKTNYIENTEIIEKDNKKFISVNLKYINKKPGIEKIKRVSKPGLRIYSSYKNIPKPLQGMGTVIISTNKGIISGDDARKKKIGGEIICEMY